MKSKWFVGFALAVALLFSWAAGGSNGVVATKEPQDFYGFLTDAFLSGQTYLKIAPDAALQNLANPWAGAQGIPRLHDASYFHGRYYLYFGPAPVLLLFLPWRVVTGTFLAQGLGTALFGAAGTLAAGALLLWSWRRWFQALGPAWLALGLLLMALASRALVLAEDSSVYQVPITCAFLCLMLALSAVAWALTRPTKQGAAGLALAGLAWSLTVASRPDYAFSAIALAVPVAYLGARERLGFAGCARLALAAFLPVVVGGTILAAYNYVRFEDILQFGMKYQFTAGDQRFLAFFSPQSLGLNLQRYFSGRPFYSAYFPFLVSGENWGVLFCTPFALLAAALPWTLARSRQPSIPGWPAWGLTLAVALLPNLVLLCVLAIANERYFVDFLPLMLLLSILSAWSFLLSLRPRSRAGSRFAQAALLGLALWTIGQGTLMTLHNYADASALRPLARLADRLAATVLGASQQGPLRMTLQFPARPPGTREPLIVSGHGQDIVYVEYLAAGRIKLGFFHVGSGGPESDPIEVVPGHSYEFRADLGALYPPADHPLLAGWPAPLAAVLQHRLDLSLDGRSVLHGAQVFYPTYPGDVHVGANPGHFFTSDRFGGQSTGLTREGLPSVAALQGPPGSGPVRLVVRLPGFQTFLHQPLLSTGHAGAGDLLYVAYVGPGVIRLGHDSWNGGALETAPLPYDPAQLQTIEADLGSLRPMAESRAFGTLALRFNGRLVLFSRRPFHASPPAEVVFGFNGCNSSTAAATFTGTIVRTERIAPLAGPAAVAGGTGPVQLVLRFPADHAGLSQPLLATGSGQAGDLLFVRYLDNHRISLGYVHAGELPRLSRPIAVDYGANHAMEISLGSLYPAAANPAWGAVPPLRRQQALQTIRVSLDGQPGLLVDQPAYPAGPRDIAVGKNRLGDSSCEPSFTGTLLLQQRLPLDSFLPPDVQDGIGPLRLTLRFPSDRPGRNEPLLVTGRTGAGDVVYVHYIDEHHLSLGFDHWNVGGPLSRPLAVESGATHVIEISLGSLYPSLGHPTWPSAAATWQRDLLAGVSVKLDGQAVIQLRQAAYPATPAEITPGANRIGASTCDASFSGEMIAEERLAPAP